MSILPFRPKNMGDIRTRYSELCKEMERDRLPPMR
jgi:hypothetical protein